MILDDCALLCPKHIDYILYECEKKQIKKALFMRQNHFLYLGKRLMKKYHNRIHEICTRFCPALIPSVSNNELLFPTFTDERKHDLKM